MPVNENENPWPDGASVSLPIGPVGIGGTYYWNPGSPTAPAFTMTGGLGMGGGGAHLVFLRKGMTSGDTLGYGANANVWMIPSVGVNASIPDENGIPKPWNARVSSVDAGIGFPGFAGTYTWTPQQIADYLLTHGLIGAARIGSSLHREALARPHPPVHFVSPAMGPDDELSPFARTLRSGVAAVGEASEPPVRYLSSRYQNPLGGGMAGWRSSADGFDPQRPAQPAPPQQSTQPASSPQDPGGLLGLLLDHLRNNPGN